MKKAVFFSIVLSISLNSCISFYRLMGGMKNPRVETKASINSFINETGLNDNNFNFMFYDSIKKVNIKKIVGNIFNSQQIIYDKNGSRKCYLGKSTCSAEQFNEIKVNFDKNIGECKKRIDTANYYNFETLKNLLAHTVNMSNQSISFDSLPKADYYFVYYWSKYSSTKKNVREDYLWYKEWIKKFSKKIIVIKINCDLRNDWGLITGKKMKIITKKIGYKEYNMTFGEIPFAK